MLELISNLVEKRNEKEADSVIYARFINLYLSTLRL